MKLKIKVTKEILDKSKNCYEEVGANCAVALAVREIFSKVWVVNHAIKIYSSTEFNCCIDEIPLPAEAMGFIRLFDSLKYNPEQRIKLPELEFEVELTEDIIKLININEVKELLKTSKTLELI